MNLIRLEPRNAAAGSALEPLTLMRNLLRWDPLRDMDLVVDRPGFLPAFDVRESPEAFMLQADVPGFRQEDLELNLTGNRLSISGRREAPTLAEGERLHGSERSFGSFCRTFSLPEGVDGGQVTAELKDGVLNLRIPKVPEVQPRRIAIRTDA